MDNLQLAYVLAGGKSTRFGTDKALVLRNGEPLIKQLIAALSNAGHLVHVVADRQERYASIKLQCLVDTVPNSGPLSGIATALDHAQKLQSEKSALLVSCDQYVWKEQWSDCLRARKSESSAQVICFSSLPAIANDKHHSRQQQPLPALYSCSLLPIVREHLAEGKLAIHQLFARATLSRIDTHDPPAHYCFNSRNELWRLEDEGF